MGITKLFHVQGTPYSWFYFHDFLQDCSNSGVLAIEFSHIFQTLLKGEWHNISMVSCQKGPTAMLTHGR